jgi:hypothetical protein
MCKKNTKASALEVIIKRVDKALVLEIRIERVIKW